MIRCRFLVAVTAAHSDAAAAAVHSVHREYQRAAAGEYLNLHNAWFDEKVSRQSLGVLMKRI